MKFPKGALELATSQAMKSIMTHKHGVDPERLHSYGFGQTQPKASNGTEEGRAINRRTEFTVRE